MSDQELEELRQAAEKLNREASASPEFARKLLIDEGIYKENGELADEYK
jgi:hypothetical protein